MLSATHIFVAGGGNLILGWKHNPIQESATIVLQGDHSTPEFPAFGGPILGSKAIGIYIDYTVPIVCA